MAGKIKAYGWLMVVLSAACCQMGARQDNKKVYYINSYHKGYPPSDQIMSGLTQALEGQHIDVKTFFLDTKNDPDDESVKQKVVKTLNEIKQFKPDCIIASDDAAIKYVIVPWFKNKSTPVVFCGVNWSAVPYGLPVANVTGMVEVLPLRRSLQTMRTYYPSARRLTVLSEQSLSEQKNTQLLDTLYRNMGFTVHYEMVLDFEHWKLKFAAANVTADIIYLPTNGAIKGWDSTEAIAFVKDYIRKPVITCDDFMMSYCVYGCTKVAKEQGQWAGKTALAILNGKAPGDIPVTANTQFQSLINRDLAARIGFTPTTELMNGSRIIQ